MRDDSMAGNHDRQWIRPHRIADGAGILAASYAERHPLIGSHRPIGDPAQDPPDILLKRRPP